MSSLSPLKRIRRSRSRLKSETFSVSSFVAVPYERIAVALWVVRSRITAESGEIVSSDISVNLNSTTNGRTTGVGVGVLDGPGPGVADGPLRDTVGVDVSAGVAVGSSDASYKYSFVTVETAELAATPLD